MRNYILKRFLAMVPTLLGITLLTFALIHLAPGDPLMAKPGTEGLRAGKVSKEIIEQTRKIYGLDKPILVQYGIWLKRIVTLDFGTSFKDQRPVWDKVAERIPVTLTLSVLAILFSYLIAIPLGILSAVKQYSLYDKISTLILFILYSLPRFWVAMLMIMLLGGGDYWDLFPIYGISSDGADGWSFCPWLLDRLWHLVLPVTCLTYMSLAALSRYQRASLLEVIRQDYIRTAYAKGLTPRRVILKHALRNALIPIITLLGYVLPYLFGGSVIIESIFTIPGLGLLGFESILNRDYPTVMALTFITAVLTLLGILLSDLLYVVVDPRISYEKAKGA